jgi:hypothetical protein
MVNLPKTSGGGSLFFDIVLNEVVGMMEGFNEGAAEGAACSGSSVYRVYKFIEDRLSPYIPSFSVTVAMYGSGYLFSSLSFPVAGLVPDYSNNLREIGFSVSNGWAFKPIPTYEKVCNTLVFKGGKHFSGFVGSVLNRFTHK